jgi:hypothetical protein
MAFVSRRRAMKHLAKPILWLLTTAIPVFIAACYGAPMENLYDGGSDPEKSVAGRVLSALTGSGIPYVKVSCLISGTGGLEVYDDAYSAPGDGAFELQSSEYSPCEILRFEDVDGADNGAYQTLDLEYVDNGQDVVAEMAEQN